MSDKEIMNAENDDIGPNDILFGRGRHLDKHPGNKAYRAIVDKYKAAYSIASGHAEKRIIAQDTLEDIKSLGGRFLKQNESSELWYEVGDIDMLKRIRQALREDAPMFRHRMKNGEESKLDSKSVSKKRKSDVMVSKQCPENANDASSHHPGNLVHHDNNDDDSKKEGDPESTSVKKKKKKGRVHYVLESWEASQALLQLQNSSTKNSTTTISFAADKSDSILNN